MADNLLNGIPFLAIGPPFYVPNPNFRTGNIIGEQVISLDAAWTKDRKAGFQPLLRHLVEQLAVFAQSGEAGRIYAAHFHKAKTRKLPPQRPLLYVPSQTDRRLTLDLERVAIPKHTPQGKLDFHAFRVTYINWIIDTGVTVRDAQALARHASPQMTLNVYGRPEQERMAEAVENMAAGAALEPLRALCVQRPPHAPERENATSELTEGCVSRDLVAGAGFEPTTFGL